MPPCSFSEVFQEYLRATVSPCHGAYHSIVQSHVCRGPRWPCSRLGTVPLLICTPCATSDKARSVNETRVSGRSFQRTPLSVVRLSSSGPCQTPCSAGKIQASLGLRKGHAMPS